MRSTSLVLLVPAALALAASMTALSAMPAELYYFTRVPPSPPGRPSRGATHVAEIAYMFDNLAEAQPWTDIDRRLADAMSTYWVNFARTGDPNGADLPSWPAFGASGKAQVLGDAIATESDTTPADAKLAFFDAAYQRQLQSGGNP